MKKFMLLVFLSLLTQMIAVTVNGYAYLEDQTNFRGINVIFQRVVPDSLAFYRVSTDSTGYFTAIVESGYYDIEYAKNGYSSTELEYVMLYSDQTLSDQTLTEKGLEGSIKGILQSGEYTVTDTLTILDGDSLIIEPGVTLNFSANTVFQLNGYLKAEGTETDSIIFRSISSIGRGLVLGNGDPQCNANMSLSYCSIEGFEYALTVYGNYGLDLIKISYSYINAIKQCIAFSGDEGNEIELTNVLIEGSIEGISQVGAGIVSLNKCRIIAFDYGCYSGTGDGLSWIIDNSLISAGIHGIYSDIASCNTVIYNSTIVAKDTGINLTFQSNSLQVSNSIIDADNYGISILNPIKNYKGTKYVSNSNVWGQTGSFNNCGSILGVIVTTNVNGDPCDGYFNISMDPLFLDEWNGDFMLTEDSPCIDSGKNIIDGYVFPLTDLLGNTRKWDGDGNGTSIVDIGAYEYGSSIPTVIENQEIEVNDYTLYQNYPNPFNPTTTINYALTQASNVELNVYNLNGQLVQSLVNGKMDKGIHKAEFNAGDLTSGMYIYDLKVDNKVISSRKMMLLK